MKESGISSIGEGKKVSEIQQEIDKILLLCQIEIYMKA
jgi:hypothetical protein